LIVCDARVEKIADGAVWVRLRPKPECRQCSAGRGCAAYLFSKGNQPGETLLAVESGGHELEPGDCVSIGIPASELQRAAMLLYFVPLVGLLCGAAAGAAYGNDLSTLTGAAAGLLLGFVPARRMDARIRAARGWRPRVVGRGATERSP
jgi:sigma-E factor negative regulatory protein RseC